MTIRAILQDGVIRPLDALPNGWVEGQHLLVEGSVQPAGDERQNLEEWAKEMEAAATAIPEEEHQRFREAMEAIERESKDAVRREWGGS